MDTQRSMWCRCMSLWMENSDYSDGSLRLIDVFHLNKVMCLCMVVIHSMSQDCPRYKLEPHVHVFNLPLIVSSDVKLLFFSRQIKVAKPPKTFQSYSCWVLWNKTVCSTWVFDLFEKAAGSIMHGAARCFIVSTGRTHHSVVCHSALWAALDRVSGGARCVLRENTLFSKQLIWFQRYYVNGKLEWAWLSVLSGLMPLQWPHRRQLRTSTCDFQLRRWVFEVQAIHELQQNTTFLNTNAGRRWLFDLTWWQENKAQ